jgi:hypothetical protein
MPDYSQFTNLNVSSQNVTLSTDQQHNQSSIHLTGLILNMLVVTLLGQRFLSKSPFTLPFSTWHSIQRYSFWALGAACIEQILDFILVILRVIGKETPVSKTILLSSGSAFLWFGAVSLLFAVLHRYERILWESRNRTKMNTIRSIAILFAIISVSLYSLNLSVTNYFTQDLSLGKFFTLSTIADVVSLFFMAAVILYYQLLMVCIRVALIK